MSSLLKRKNLSKEYDPYHRQNQTRTVKNFFLGGSLLAVLVWGVSFLLITIKEFRMDVVTNNQLEHYLKSNSPPLFEKDTNKEWKSLFGDKVPLNFTAVRDGKFRPSYKELQWIREPFSEDKGTYLLKKDVDGKVEYNIESIIDEDYKYTLFNDSSFEYEDITYEVNSLIASPNLKKAILKTNSTRNWRHSTFALYWLLDVDTNLIEPIFDTTHKLAVTSWSPQSTDIAFIYENNVYIKNLKSGKTSQVTSDGGEQVFYGKPDWVYEEEVFSGDIVLWWSPLGDKVTFLKSNDTEVPEFTIPYYVQKDTDDYPEVVKIKYPKPGYPNPIVDLVVYDLSTGKDELVQLKSDNIDAENRLITEVVWVKDSVLVKTSNRASDLLEIFLINTIDNSAKLIRSHKAEDSWFEVTSNTLYVPKNESLGRHHEGYIDTVVHDGFNHLAYFSPPENPHGQLLTKGRWEVLSGVESFNYATNEVYFVSTLKSSVERHIHSIDLLDRSNHGLPKIADITDGEGWYVGSFSGGSRYLLLTYSGPHVPYQHLVDLKDNAMIKTLEDNSNISENLKKYVIPKTIHQTVDLTDEETGQVFKANAIETLPLNFNPYHKYPVLFFVYGGPGSQTVTKRFDVGFSSVVAAELNAVVVTVDGRGTGFNNLNEMGAKFKFIVRDRLGQYEPMDQIAAGKVWAEKSYVDSSRMAIWGWSYGGFLTLKTLESDYVDRVFSYGVSIAPVTKWKLYDSIYTERYLRTPQENPAGYETASIHNVTNFKDVKKFFIGHGSGDDNVHVQNTLKLLDNFNMESVENFDFMIFPDSDHSITYHNAGKIVYDRILDFLRRSFKGDFI